MSRNSSGRSSYSYKSQEDFQDEILDLKRELVKLKEESRTLKVKLRRSEENAARKEKIICNMIDPLKAHLSAKSVKCQKKGSVKKEVQNSNKCSLSKVHHSICSRAYRHDAKSYEISKDVRCMMCIDDLPRPDQNIKKPMKVNTVIESMHEPHIDIPNAVLSVRPVAVKDRRYENYNCPINVTNGEVSNRTVACTSKHREGTLISPVKMSNAQKGRVNKKNTKGKTKKKKSLSEKNARSLLFQVCASSENEEDSYSSYVATNPTKTNGNVRANHSETHTVDKVAHNSGNCKRCHSKYLKSVDNGNDNAVTHRIENLIKGGKNLLSLWDADNGRDMKNLDIEGNFKSICMKKNSDEQSLSKECGSNKFGMYLINEHDEVEDSGCVDIIVAEDESETLESWREVDSKVSPSCLIERRASIFRVDIRKKDPTTGNECTGDESSQKTSNEMIYKNGCEASREAGFNVTDKGELELYKVRVDADCQVMEHLLGTLSVADKMARNNFAKVEPNRGRCLRNTLENLLAATGSEGGVGNAVGNENGFQQRMNVIGLCSRNSNYFTRCLTGVVSRKSKFMCSKVYSSTSCKDFASPQGYGMDFHDNVTLLGIISLPSETWTLLPTLLENV